MQTKRTLYSFLDLDRSGRVRWLMHELDVPFEEKRLDFQKGEQKSAAYLGINPFGTVPTLLSQEHALFESGAICFYLTETFPERHLAPAPGEQNRAAYIQWSFFGSSTLEDATFPWFAHKQFNVPLVDAQATEKKLDGVLRGLSESLEGNQYILGNTFSTADILISYPLGLLDRHGKLDAYPVLKTYKERLEKRPAAVASAVFSTAFPKVN